MKTLEEKAKSGKLAVIDVLKQFERGRISIETAETCLNVMQIQEKTKYLDKFIELSNSHFTGERSAGQ